MVVAVVTGLSGLSACQSGDSGAVSYEPSAPTRTRERGIQLFGLGSSVFGGEDTSGAKIGVNALLWRAALDTVSFMPLGSADPFGGVIITDWYSPPQSPEERFKINVYILGRTLRADGVRAAVFRQRQSGAAGWVDAPVGSSTATELENAILTRARQLRIAQIGE